MLRDLEITTLARDGPSRSPLPPTLPRTINDKAAFRRPVRSYSNTKSFWSGRRDSNPRPRPWQGRALPLSYTRIREIGGDHSPATGRAMPNAHRECNSRRAAWNRPDDPITAIMARKSPRNGSRMAASPIRRVFRQETRRLAGWHRAQPPTRSPVLPAIGPPDESCSGRWNRLKFPGKPPLKQRELLNHHHSGMLE